MKKNRTTVAAVIAFAVSAAMPLMAHSQSATRGVYVGVGLGQAEAVNYGDKVCTPLLTTDCKQKGDVFRFFGGWQFGRNWAVEMAYSDLGKITASIPGTFDQDVKTRLGEMTLVGSWPATNHIAFYGKVGGYYANASTQTTQNGVEQKVSQGRGNYTFGAGIQWYMTPRLALRGEGQHYVKVGTTVGDLDYNVYTVGLLFKF